MKYFSIIFFLAFTFLVQNLTDAQNWVSYQSQQKVNDLVDTGAELYLATDRGLVIMNKSSLEKTFFDKTNSNLSNNHIQSILRVDGTTWIGTYDALVTRFVGNDFEEAIAPQSSAYDPESTELYDFEIAPNGDIWLGTSDGIFHRQGQNWSHYDVADIGEFFFEAWDIAINEEGDVFVGSFHVFQFSNGVWSDLSLTTDMEGYLGADLFFSETGDLYFAGDLDQIGRFDGQSWQDYSIDFNGSEAIGFTEDVDGNMYFNTLRNGVFKLVDNAWIPEVDAQTTAFNNETDYFYIDDQNNRWLNSKIYLSVNDNGTIQNTLITPTTLESNNVTDIHKGTNGNMYFVNTANVISVLDTDGNWSFFPLPVSLMPFEKINDMIYYTANDTWLATDKGLYQYLGSEWAFYELGPCRSLVDDSQGKIYVRSVGKVYIVDTNLNNEISEYNTDNSPIADLIISSIGVDAADNLWLGLFNWDGDATIQKVSSDGTWTSYTKADHPAIKRPQGVFHFDADGNAWLADDFGGAIKFDGEQFTNPIQENSGQISNNEIHKIASDANGKLYFAHPDGLTTLFNGEWENFINEDATINFSSTAVSMAFDDKGTLWWGNSSNGLFSFQPESSSSVQSTLDITPHFTVFPNPAQAQTNIEFTTKENSTVKALIYNQIGQLQSHIDFGQLPAGTFQRSIPLSDLSKGIYLLQLQFDNRSFTEVLVVQ